MSSTTNMRQMESVLAYAHRLVSDTLAAGDKAVDATVGNGVDTLLLARLVGPGGHVYGFDVQQVAIERATARLRAEGVDRYVTLFEQDHARMLEVLGNKIPEGVGAVMFNLGYLPGGDKSVTTQAESTLRALDEATGILAPSGIVTVVVYRGHPGATAECEAVVRWASALDQRDFSVLRYEFINQLNAPPLLVAIRKEKKGDSRSQR